MPHNKKNPPKSAKNYQPKISPIVLQNFNMKNDTSRKYSKNSKNSKYSQKSNEDIKIQHRGGSYSFETKEHNCTTGDTSGIFNDLLKRSHKIEEVNKLMSRIYIFWKEYSNLNKVNNF